MKINDIVTVFVDGRHDFQRKARVVMLRGGFSGWDEAFVHYFEYPNLPREWIPKNWVQGY